MSYFTLQKWLRYLPVLALPFEGPINSFCLNKLQWKVGSKILSTVNMLVIKIWKTVQHFAGFLLSNTIVNFYQTFGEIKNAVYTEGLLLEWHRRGALFIKSEHHLHHLLVNFCSTWMKIQRENGHEICMLWKKNDNKTVE